MKPLVDPVPSRNVNDPAAVAGFRLSNDGAIYPAISKSLARMSSSEIGPCLRKLAEYFLGSLFHGGQAPTGSVKPLQEYESHRSVATWNYFAVEDLDPRVDRECIASRLRQLNQRVAYSVGEFASPDRLYDCFFLLSLGFGLSLGVSQVFLEVVLDLSFINLCQEQPGSGRPC